VWVIWRFLPIISTVISTEVLGKLVSINWKTVSLAQQILHLFCCGERVWCTAIEQAVPEIDDGSEMKFMWSSCDPAVLFAVIILLQVFSGEGQISYVVVASEEDGDTKQSLCSYSEYNSLVVHIWHIKALPANLAQDFNDIHFTFASNLCKARNILLYGSVPDLTNTGKGSATWDYSCMTFHIKNRENYSQNERHLPALTLNTLWLTKLV